MKPFWRKFSVILPICLILGVFITTGNSIIHADDPIVIDGGSTPDISTETMNPSNPNCKEGGDIRYCFLEPLFHKDDNSLVTAIDTSTTLGDYIGYVFKLMLSIISLLAFIMLFLAGIEYMSIDAFTGKEEAKSKIMKILGGLVLALFAWLLLYTINPDLVNLSIAPPNVSLEIDYLEKPDEAPPTEGNKVCPQSPTIHGTTITSGMAWDTTGTDTNATDENPGADKGRRDFLTQQSSGGIAVVGSGGNANCAHVGDTGCTTLGQFPSGALSKIVNLYNACKTANSGTCTGFQITGGTECWLHKSHGPNLPRVDIDDNSSYLNHYIETAGTQVNDDKTCHKGQYDKYKLTGNVAGIYVHEGDHWHICF